MENNISKNGFTLIELLIVASILSVVIAGIINLYIYTSVAAQLAGNKTLAVSEAQSKIEEIRNHTFDDITVDYTSGGTPGNTFSLSQLNGIGVIYIDSSNAELLEIEVIVSWQDKYNRVIGEDLDLDGILDAGEDVNGNGKLDSIIKVESMVTRR